MADPINIDVKFNVDDEELQDAADTIEAVANSRPNITIRNNSRVYVTINYFGKEAGK